MAPDILWLVVGLALLMLGGEAIVRGATGLARDLGVSPLVIGLTVVAFGTSAPELAVNVIASSQGNGAVAFGNVIGSNMANIGLIVGLTALVRPIVVTGGVTAFEFPMMLIATFAAVAMGFDIQIRGAGHNAYDTVDGLLLLMFFLIFLRYTVVEVVRQRADNGNGALLVLDRKPGGGVWKHALFTLFGLVLLIGGADLSVNSAVEVARAFGVPEDVIGLTVLAVGTSLPELVASLAATLRGHAGLAVGNVVGSNIFNLLLVLGVATLVGSVPVPARGQIDLLVMALLSLLFFLASKVRSRGIIRTDAAVLLLLYFVYLAWRSGQALSG